MYAAERGPEVEQVKERLIRERAYEIWEQEGQPEGREPEYWLRAKREVEPEAWIRRPGRHIETLGTSD
jgi:hypothetical protein